MITHGTEIKIFSGNSNKALAKKIAQYVGVPLGNSDVYTFSDGEIAVDINETVRGADVFVIQSTCAPVNDYLMELLIMMDAFKRASAGRITAVIPYYGYARQDRKAKARDPITAKLVADLITSAGADRVLTMDFHARQLQGFFNIPVDHLLGAPILVKHFIEADFCGDDVCVVSPDLGAVTRARNLANRLDASLAIIDKRRPRINETEVMNVIGNVEGKRIILIDDIIDTAGTLIEGVETLLRMGAKEAFACCTHGVLSGPAVERINQSQLKKVVITDTIPLEEGKNIDKIHVLSVAPVFAEAIDRIYEDLPVSTLFE